MEGLKRNPDLLISRRDCQGIVEQLGRRSFTDILKAAKDRDEQKGIIRNGEVPEAVFSKEMGEFELMVGVYRRLDRVLLEQRGIADTTPEQLRLVARFGYVGDRSLALLVRAHPEKSHFMPVKWAGSENSGYAADIVPSHDVSMLVARCIALEEALRGVRADGRFAEVLDAQEVVAKLEAAYASISERNALKPRTGEYIKPLLTWASQRIHEAGEFLRTERRILEALEDVADK
jgi:hypothetical protein